MRAHSSALPILVSARDAPSLVPAKAGTSLRLPPRGARNAGPHRTRVLQDLTILKHSGSETQLRRNLGVPRAVFGGLLREIPGGQTLLPTAADWYGRLQGRRCNWNAISSSTPPSVQPSGHLPGARAFRGLDRHIVGRAYCARDAATASGPASRRLMKRPSVDRTQTNLILSTGMSRSNS
jgi:hypothetical protein